MIQPREIYKSRHMHGAALTLPSWSQRDHASKCSLYNINNIAMMQLREILKSRHAQITALHWPCCTTYRVIMHLNICSICCKISIILQWCDHKKIQKSACARPHGLLTTEWPTGWHSILPIIIINPSEHLWSTSESGGCQRRRWWPPCIGIHDLGRWEAVVH